MLWCHWRHSGAPGITLVHWPLARNSAPALWLVLGFLVAKKCPEWALAQLYLHPGLGVAHLLLYTLTLWLIVALGPYYSWLGPVVIPRWLWCTRTDTSTSLTVLTPTLSELSIKSNSIISESLMEQTSDIRSELVEEPSSHMSKVGTVVVQWWVPSLQIWPWHPEGISSACTRSSETSLNAWQGLEASNWHVPAT